MDVADAPRAGPARARRQQRGDLRGDRRRLLQRRAGGDRWRDGAAGRGWRADRRGRVGRRSEPVRRGDGGQRAICRFEPRTASGRGAGNGIDTNDNANDFFVQAAPSPQNGAAPPVPEPGATPTPAPAPAPTQLRRRRRPDAEPDRDADAHADATPEPTPTPTPAPTPTPPPPDADAHAHPGTTRRPTPTPTPTPSRRRANADPEPRTGSHAIADVRLLQDGASVTLEGILTTALGGLEGGRGGFVQDATGGIALYLDDPAVAAWPAGTQVRASGVVASRYGQRTIRLAEADLVRGESFELPEPEGVSTGTAGETLEGLRITVAGTTVGAASALADGLGVTVDDGTGGIRAVIGPDALAGRALPSGTSVVVTGPLGQRDSSGTGTSGYRDPRHACRGARGARARSNPYADAVAKPGSQPVAEPDRDPRTHAIADTSAKPDAGHEPDAATEPDPGSHPGDP